MSLPGIILHCVALFFLTGYLWLKFQQRDSLRREAKVSEWNGKVINAAPLLPKLHHVRQTYKIEQTSRPGRHMHRRNLIALARTALSHLGYFARRETS
jgi:hypothetical protein